MEPEDTKRTPFVAANPLEEALAAACRRWISVDKFWEVFLASPVVVPLDSPVDEVRRIMNPLVVNDPRGFSAVALFTSMERAKPAMARFPAYKYALQTDCRWLLIGIQPTAGIALNIGCECSFTLPPDAFAEMKSKSGIATQAPYLR